MIWPEEKTAVLVIHGAGAHRRFQALDGFVRGFSKFLRLAGETYGRRPSLEHKLRRCADQIESYVSLVPGNQRDAIDFYEYFWDPHMVRGNNLLHPFRWMVGLSKGFLRWFRGPFRRFRMERRHERRKAPKRRRAERKEAIVFGSKSVSRSRQLAQAKAGAILGIGVRAEGDGREEPAPQSRAGGRVRVKDAAPFDEARPRLARQVLHSVQALPPEKVGDPKPARLRLDWAKRGEKRLPNAFGLFVKVLGFCFALFMVFYPLLPLFWLLSLFGARLLDFFWDVIRYAQADVRSEYFAARRDILAGAVRMLSDLLNSDYEQIVVAGHSLGSVIAYDALNLISQHALAGVATAPTVPAVDEAAESGPGISREELKRIVLLVTFGSPLEKLAFFYEGGGGADCVRRQMVDHLHSWKRWVPEGPPDEGPTTDAFLDLEWPFGPHPLNHVMWLNFYHRFDPVGDELFFYSPTNVDVKDRRNLFGAHGSYWDSMGMYAKICWELGWLEAPVS